jgi:hypothetical protein
MKLPTVPCSRKDIEIWHIPNLQKKTHTGGKKKHAQDKTVASIGHEFAPYRRYQLQNFLSFGMTKCMSEPRMVALVVRFSLVRVEVVVGKPQHLRKDNQPENYYMVKKVKIRSTRVRQETSPSSTVRRPA